MPRQERYRPHPFIQLVFTALDELIEAQSDSLVEYYLSALEKWEVPQGAFEDLLASSPRIQGCGDWDVETFWTEIGEADRRMQPLLWLQRSTRHSQGDHAIVTFSKPTPVRAARTRIRTAAAAELDAARHQQALTSTRRVRANTSSASTSSSSSAHRNTTSIKNVWDHVNGGNGNFVESWNTIEMEKGEKKFMNSLATFETLSVRCQFCHEHYFTKNTTQAQAKVCPKCVYDPNHVKKRDRRVVLVDNGQSFYLLSHDNDMDPFYVHGTVLIRARKWRSTQNLGEISDVDLKKKIEDEFRALPELTLVEKCMISLAVPIMTIGRIKKKNQTSTFVGNCISISQNIENVVVAVLPRKPGDATFPLMIVKQQIRADEGDATEYAEFQVKKKNLVNT